MSQMFANDSLIVTRSEDQMDTELALADIRAHPTPRLPAIHAEAPHSLVPSAPVVVCIDTNILISQPELLAKLAQVISPALAVFYIPAVVVRELDGLKSSEKHSVKSAAIRATSWLLNQLSGNSGLFFGQRVKDIRPADSPDDEIVQACLFARASFATTGKVVLMTGDKNLSVKAVINDILVQSPDWDPEGFRSSIAKLASASASISTTPSPMPPNAHHSPELEAMDIDLDLPGHDPIPPWTPRASPTTDTTVTTVTRQAVGYIHQLVRTLIYPAVQQCLSAAGVPPPASHSHRSAFSVILDNKTTFYHRLTARSWGQLETLDRDYHVLQTHATLDVGTVLGCIDRLEPVCDLVPDRDARRCAMKQLAEYRGRLIS